MTLVEIMVALAVASILLLAVATLGLYGGRSFAGLANYTDLDARSRHALDRLTASTSTSLTFEDADGSSLQYVYSPDDRTLSRVKGGVTEVLLTECDNLSFAIFQRNPINGTYNQYPTASPATTKLINVTWTCSRKILGNTMNTENVQTAKVVIRKQ
jgi:hypothetical protein